MRGAGGAGREGRSVMSRIFDALQKAGKARSGARDESAAEVLDVLRDAECLWSNGGRNSAGAERDSQSVVSLLGAIGQAQPFEAFPSLQVSAAAGSRLVALLEPQSAAAEAFRMLSVRLCQLQRDVAIRSLLLTSAIPQEGKSTVAANLACMLGGGGAQKVLLLEGDARRPSLMKMFGLEAGAGRKISVRQGRELTDQICYLQGAGIWLLPAGQAAEGPVDFLEMPQLSSQMEQLKEWFDWIVIDSPPIVPLADGSVWMRVADAILLVVRMGCVEKRELEKALEILDRQKLLGAVLNCARTPAHSDYYYGTLAPDGEDPDSASVDQGQGGAR